MAIHQEIGEIQSIAGIEEPVERLVTFYLSNGYSFDTIIPPSDASKGDQDAPGPVHLLRGKPGNGWWSSNMTELHTQLVIHEREDAIEIAYTVDVSGQILKESERAFWTRERKAAEKYLREPSSVPPDLRINETARADNKSKSLISVGLWGGVTAFLIIVFLGFVGII